MASDAYMELQDPAVWGETLDEQFGLTGRASGPSRFLALNLPLPRIGRTTRTPRPQSPPPPAPSRARTAGSGVGSAALTQPVVKSFTIKKFIDKASPDLMVACCKAGMPDAKKIAWAIISFRETGDIPESSAGSAPPPRIPFLIIEFQGLWVESFAWSMTPGAESTSASQEETVTFSFETILIKYARQELTGTHTPVKINSFNRVDPKKDVDPLPPVESLRG